MQHISFKSRFFKPISGIQSGELKHGPLALVDETVPIIMVIMRDNVHTKCMNALQQVTARKGRPIIVCEKGDTVTKIFNKILFIHCLTMIYYHPILLYSLFLHFQFRKHKSGQVKTDSLKCPRQLMPCNPF